MHSASIWLSSLTLAAAGGWFAATMFAAPATSKASSSVQANEAAATMTASYPRSAEPGMNTKWPPWGNGARVLHELPTTL